MTVARCSLSLFWLFRGSISGIESFLKPKNGWRTLNHYTRSRCCFPLISLQKFQKRQSMSTASAFERLPRNVLPVNYKIDLQLDLKSCVFDGFSAVQLKVVEPTPTVTLNSLEIDVKSAEYVSEDGKAFKANISVSKPEEKVTLSFHVPLPQGSGQLKMAFSGTINDKLRGLYRIKYKGANGEDRFGAVTQFEASDARRAFPCWDEPSFKATFDITLIVPKDMVALSNCHVVSDQPWTSDPALREVKFATTPKMSTYLVALIVGEYDYVEAKSSDGIIVRVYTPVGKKEQGLFSLDVASKALPFYRDYFNVAYPLPKLDLVAVGELASGAMENWGLVTYRESLLLVDPQNTSALKKQSIALVVTHELAHMWFGNLVTMEWWTDLWLNEGFASFMEFLCVDHLFPEFKMWTQFVTDTYTTALQLDALDNSHPIEVPVQHPKEIDEIFDDISYNKGASVLRMLHAYICDEDFRKGMNLYLTKHKYGNTVTKDLWKSLASACNRPIEEVMSTWVKQKGYPVISVSSRQDGPHKRLTISQEKFCAGGRCKDDHSQWMVPITICTSKSPSTVAKQLMLDTKSTEVAMENVSSSEWVKVNLGTVGFYRTLYAEDMLDQLIPAVKDKVLPPLDRLGLLDDLFALVQSGHKSTVEVMKLMEAYVNEDDYTVWCAISSCLGKLNQLLLRTDLQSLFHAYGRKLLDTIFSKSGWDPKPNEGHLDTLLRSIIIKRLVRFKDEKVLAEAKRRFDRHVDGTATILADIRSPVYDGVASVADKTTYDALLKLYRSADLQEEKNRISRALGSASDPELIQRTLDFALSGEVRLQDAVFVIIPCSSSKEGQDLAWQFFQAHNEELQSRLGSGFLSNALVKHITESFASEEKALEVEEFFQQHPFPGTERAVQQSVENIRLKARWLERDGEAIKQYLLSH